MQGKPLSRALKNTIWEPLAELLDLKMPCSNARLPELTGRVVRPPSRTPHYKFEWRLQMSQLKGSKTEENLKAAFSGESQANRRYLYFAAKADVEGQNDVAALFRSTAE